MVGKTQKAESLAAQGFQPFTHAYIFLHTYLMTQYEDLMNYLQVGSYGDTCFAPNFRRDGDGYTQVKHNGTQKAGHRLALAHKLGRELTKDECALHHCDNPPCVNPNHLYLGNRSDNNKDAYDRGRKKKNWKKSSFSESDVALVIELLKNGMTQQKVASEFHVSRGAIRYVVDKAKVS